MFIRRRRTRTGEAAEQRPLDEQTLMLTAAVRQGPGFRRGREQREGVRYGGRSRQRSLDPTQERGFPVRKRNVWTVGLPSTEAPFQGVWRNGSTGTELRELLNEFGVEEKDVLDARRYWTENPRPAAKSVLSFEEASDVVTYLMDRGIPVRDLPQIVRKCPALLMASVELDLAPRFDLFEELQIEGSSLSNLCLSEPRILLEGRLESIRHVVLTLRRLGIHKSKVQKIIAAQPVLVLESVDAFVDAMMQLSHLFASEEDLVLYIGCCPQLIFTARRRFKAVHKVLETVGMTHAETLECVRRGPKLLLRDPENLKAVREWFATELSVPELKAIFRGYPLLLIRQVSALQAKKRFLVSVARRPFRDILSFPNYFNYGIERVIGPRFTFLKDRGSPILQQAPLDILIRTTNEEFANRVAHVLEAEYLVYQAQWTRMYGHKFEYVGRPRKDSPLS